MELQERIAAIFHECGIVHWGACAFAPLKEQLLPCRAKSRIPADARAVLCAIFPYRVDAPGRNLSHYAIPPDYHDVLPPLLRRVAKQLSAVFPDFRFEAFADNSPVPEVRAAALCGLGVVGDNGLLITPEYGSWVFLGEIVTDLPLETEERPVRGCLHCGACRRACPGGALTTGPFDKGRCLSHLSQKKGELTPQETALLLRGNLIWGCDRCQESCPMNRNVKECDFPPLLVDRIPSLCPGDAEKLTGRAYNWRPARVIERNLKLMEKKRI